MNTHINFAADTNHWNPSSILAYYKANNIYRAIMMACIMMLFMISYAFLVTCMISMFVISVLCFWFGVTGDLHMLDQTAFGTILKNIFVSSASGLFFFGMIDAFVILIFG